MEWYAKAKREITDIEAVDAYLAVNPFSAQQTSDNEDAYEKLMDCRMKLYVSELFLIFFGKSKLSETKIVKPHDFFYHQKIPQFCQQQKTAKPQRFHEFFPHQNFINFIGKSKFTLKNVG